MDPICIDSRGLILRRQRHWYITQTEDSKDIDARLRHQLARRRLLNKCIYACMYICTRGGYCCSKPNQQTSMNMAGSAYPGDYAACFYVWKTANDHRQGGENPTYVFHGPKLARLNRQEKKREIPLLDHEIGLVYCIHTWQVLHYHKGMYGSVHASSLVPRGSSAVLLAQGVCRSPLPLAEVPLRF